MPIAAATSTTQTTKAPKQAGPHIHDPKPGPIEPKAKAKAKGADIGHSGAAEDMAHKIGKAVQGFGERIGSGIKDIAEGIKHIDPKLAGTGGAWSQVGSTL